MPDTVQGPRDIGIIIKKKTTSDLFNIVSRERESKEKW